MKQIGLFIYFLINISLVSSESLVIKSNSLCKISREIKNHICSGKYEFECTKDYCSTNLTTCENFFKLKSITKTFTTLLFNQRRSKEYASFIGSIKTCSLPKFKKSINSSNICLSKEDCFIKEKFKYKYSFQNYLKKIVCPCNGQHHVYCGKNYCATSQTDCDLFLKHEQIFSSSGRRTSFNECKSDKKVFIKISY